MLALGNLRHRGLRSWLTLIGILIGITAVVALVMLGDGLEMAVMGQFGISTTDQGSTWYCGKAPDSAGVASAAAGITDLDPRYLPSACK